MEPKHHIGNVRHFGYGLFDEDGNLLAKAIIVDAAFAAVTEAIDLASPRFRAPLWLFRAPSRHRRCHQGQHCH